MKYVYILQSLASPEHDYAGISGDVHARLQKHNAGEVPYTSRHVPWALKTYISFTDEKKAFEFEAYMKTASGRAFAKKRL